MRRHTTVLVKNCSCSVCHHIATGIQDMYGYIANSLSNISHIPLVLPSSETEMFSAKHRTFTRHIMKSACLWVAVVCFDHVRRQVS